MTANLLIFVCLLAAILFVLVALRQLLRRRLLTGVFGGLVALALFLAAAVVALLAGDLRTYQRLNFEQSAAQLQFSRIGDRQYRALLTYPGGTSDVYLLRGDEWQIDARLIKWHALANVLGFDAAFRLERLGGRYANIDDERTLPRSVYALNPARHPDLWDLVRMTRRWLPWLDALYGSAAYLPMADGALFEVRVSQTGLVARPLNGAADAAVGGWH